jgi:CDP-diacylglycerol--glycerol-3-phosphate 3-phosphatidyltransferase
VLDSAVDRVNDVIYLAAVVSVGAPLELAIACGFLFFFLEYVRARAGNAGGDEVGRITIAERPNRVIFLSASIHFGGVFLAHRDLVATTGLAVMTVLSVIGVGQLLVTVRRQLLSVTAD